MDGDAVVSGPADRAGEAPADHADLPGADQAHAPTTAASGPAPVPTRAHREPRDALIYVGGLELGLTRGRSIAGVVNRLQAAADREAETGPATFQVRFLEDSISPGSTPGPHLRRVATLFRTDSATEKAAFDLFEYSWSATLTSQWEAQGRARRTARACLTALRIPRFVRFWRTSGRKTPFGRLQLALAGAISIVAIIYLVLLLSAAVQSITQLPTLTSDNEPQAVASSTPATPAENPPDQDQPAPADAEGDTHPGITWVQWSAIVSTLVLPLVTKRREDIARVGAATFAANAYLRIGDNRERIVEGLVAGAERLREDSLYTAVHVIAYSFGGVVAMDALFPRSGPPERSFDKVSKLVTIGIPYEFVQAVEPEYWNRRHRGQDPPSWTNIYSRIDLLGSNLRKDQDDGVAELGINTGDSDASWALLPEHNITYDTGIELDWITILELYGFISHGMYWGRDDTPDRNVFRQVIHVLYEGGPALA